MTTTSKLFTISHLLGWLFIGALAGSCTKVYFKKPVPQNGSALREIPATWAGEYEEEPAPGEEASIYRHFINLERLSPTLLFVTEDIRIRASDMPRLKHDLDSLKNAGVVLEYLLTDHFLLSTVPVSDTSRPDIKEEKQVTRLFRQGDWYVISASAKPTMLFDLENSTTTGYDVQTCATTTEAPVPGTDSLSTSSVRLVARQNNNGFFLNQVAKEDGSLWELYYVVQPSPDELVFKSSVLKNKDLFEKRLKYYNKITPFAQSSDGNAYIIDPSDEALERLMADEDLFQVTRLRKINSR